MAGYSHVTWACPFFKWDERTCVHCEGGKQVFYDVQAARDYARRYCANVTQWGKCTVADSLVRYYDRVE